MGEERFSLILLEEDEYYFRDYPCSVALQDQGNDATWVAEDDPHFSSGGGDPGLLKVCSTSLYFVPANMEAAIIRVPLRHVTAVIGCNSGALTATDEPGSGGGGERNSTSDGACTTTPSADALRLQVDAEEVVELERGGRASPYELRKGCFKIDLQVQQQQQEQGADSGGGGRGGGPLPVLQLVQRLQQVAVMLQTKEGQQAGREALEKIIQEHEDHVSFNPQWLLGEGEAVFADVSCTRIMPLVRQAGRVVVTSLRLYLQPFGVTAAAQYEAFDLAEAVSLYERTYELTQHGLEVYLRSHPAVSLYLVFGSKHERDAVMQVLQCHPRAPLDQQRSVRQWTSTWLKGSCSNASYLHALNRAAGRSVQDLGQYPVMPWVLQDYHSRELDLGDATIYRDLSKPMGALNPQRLASFKERFKDLQHMEAEARREARKLKQKGGPPPQPQLSNPPFLYGCHYSTPGYVAYFLLRSHPRLMLKLQNGRFDSPDRLFWSMADTWASCLSLPADVKELTPEFYGHDPAFLQGGSGLNFGSRAGGERVMDVQLPPWASSAEDFLSKHARALESPHVSARLHTWVDLVFGCKSRNTAAAKADNLFHYLTYDNLALKDLQQESDPVLREALRVQILEFGRTPQQLFKRKHPRKKTGGTAPRMPGCVGLSNRSLRALSMKALRTKHQPPLRISSMSGQPQQLDQQQLSAAETAGN